MSLSNAVIDAMLAAGCSAVQLAAAMKASNADIEVRAERKRANNAERQRRFKARRHADNIHDVTHDNTGNALPSVTSVTSVTPVALSLPPNENNSNPPPIPTQDITPVREEPIFHIEFWRDFHAKRLGKFKVPRRMPEEWEPVLTENAQRMVDGWPPGDGETPGMFDQQLAAFRDHAADKGRTSKDWQAAFRTWITNANRWKPANDRSSKSGRPPASSREGDGLTRTLDLVDAALAGQSSFRSAWNA